MKINFLILFFGLVINVNAQLAHPYRVFSENGEFIIKSVPFSDQVWTEDGKTYIFQKADTTKSITTVNRYFQPDFLFLSNDGTSFCFLLNWNPHSEWKDVVFFYSKGSLVKKYQVRDFVDTTSTSRINSICYNNEDIDSLVEEDGMLVKAGFKKGTDSLSAYFNTNNAFSKNDTLYLLTNNQFVNRFNLRTGELIDRISFANYSKSKLVYPKKRVIQDYKIKIPTQFGLPKLKTGEDYCIALGKALKMVYCGGENADYERKYKHYGYEIYCGIDSLGHVVDLQIDCLDSLLRNGTERFLRNAKFEETEIPNGIERWYFGHIANFRKESKALARKERKQEIIEEKHEYQKRIVSDSIDGVYIPKDINDCFTQLNIILDPIDLKEFKNLPEDEVSGQSHFGIGLWIRNNWNLWGGSRLSFYFNSLGIKHPDDMSGIVLNSYHRFLNNRDIDLNGQISHYQQYWKNQKNTKVIKFKPPKVTEE